MPKWKCCGLWLRTPTITESHADFVPALEPQAAMDRAVELAAHGPAYGPNPRVGCVITDAEGMVLGEGYHRGAGSAHAEVAALGDVTARGNSAQGATAYVTLEPCAHTGRTGPCTQALLESGVTKVRFALADPNPLARGGAEALKEAGVDVEHMPRDAAAAINRRWLAAVAAERPYVIAKWASTLDGRTAAVDGSSFWITGEPARDHAHQVRADVDAIVVGTGTVVHDNPELSARPGGTPHDHQPLRVVMGVRDTNDFQVWRDQNCIAARTHDPAEVLSLLHAREVRTVLVEGGATITSAFLKAGLVDEVHAYIAPAILGAGTAAVNELGIGTMSDALRGGTVEAQVLGDDTLITATFSRGT